MSSLVTNTIFFGVSCIALTRCNEITNTTKSGNEGNQPNADSLDSVTDQLQTIDPLIWIIIVLICVVCCLSTAFICYCVMQTKFNKDMAEVHRISQLTLKKQLSSYSTRTEQNQNKLHPPSNGNTPQSHTMSSNKEIPTFDNLPKLPKTMAPSLQTRSKSAESAIPHAISINMRPNQLPSHATGMNSNHQYVDSVRMWTNPVYNSPRRQTISGHTNAMSLTIPTRYEIEYSNNSQQTMVTLSSNNGSRQRTSPKQHQKRSSVQRQSANPRQYSSSLPSRVSHDQQPPTPVLGASVPAAMNEMAAQKQQSMIYTPHKSSLRSIRSMVPHDNTAYNAPLPHMTKVKSSKQRMNMNLAQALNALAAERKVESPEAHLSPPLKYEDASTDIAWTEASVTGVTVGDTVGDMSVMTDGFVGMFQNKDDDKDSDGTVESY